MPHSVKERITIGWCDNGTVEGRFMSGITNIIIEAPKENINIVNTIRVTGNQIARQRQSLWDFWADSSDSEWLLWVDSDIVVTPSVLKKLWEVADKKNKPVVTGVYFVSNQTEQSLMEPVPAIYMETGDKYRTKLIHPLPEDKVIPVDVAGFGLILMHRSIIEPVRKVAGDFSVFGENQQAKDKFVSEDVSFCRKLKEAGIQLYAHTGATVQHMKTFSFDNNYYRLYWNGIETDFIRKPGHGRSKSNTSEG
jgi:GT2 family glycosyltransferase